MSRDRVSYRAGRKVTRLLNHTAHTKPHIFTPISAVTWFSPGYDPRRTSWRPPQSSRILSSRQRDTNRSYRCAPEFQAGRHGSPPHRGNGSQTRVRLLIGVRITPGRRRASRPRSLRPSQEYPFRISCSGRSRGPALAARPGPDPVCACASRASA
jgi:hypothetical protein